MLTVINFPPSFFEKLEKLKQSGFSMNRFVIQAVAEKFKRDFNIDVDITDRRHKEKLYRAK